MIDAESHCEFVQTNDCWIPTASLKTANVLLTKTGNLGKSLLG